MNREQLLRRAQFLISPLCDSDTRKDIILSFIYEIKKNGHYPQYFPKRISKSQIGNFKYFSYDSGYDFIFTIKDETFIIDLLKIEEGIPHVQLSIRKY